MSVKRPDTASIMRFSSKRHRYSRAKCAEILGLIKPAAVLDIICVMIRFESLVFWFFPAASVSENFFRKTPKNNY